MYQGASSGSLSAEGRRRKVDWAEREVELLRRPDRLDLFDRELWGQDDPADLSHLGPKWSLLCPYLDQSRDTGSLGKGEPLGKAALCRGGTP